MRRRLYPVRSARVIYIKGAVAPEMAKKQKSPRMSRKNPGLTQRAFLFSEEDGEVYAEKVSLSQVPIEMICSDFFVISGFSPFEKSFSEGKVRLQQQYRLPQINFTEVIPI